MSPLSPEKLTELLARELPAVDRHGETVDEVGESHVRISMPVTEEYLSRDLPPGTGQVVVSGPSMMRLADTAMYACIHAFYGERAYGVILSVNTTFLSVAGEGDLSTVARLIKKGQSIAFLEAEIFSADSSEPSARVSATYKVWRSEREV
ncbi:MAG: PaaI family thioesterase [Nitrospiraceae bacterium]